MAEDPKNSQTAPAQTTRANPYATTPLACDKAWKEVDDEADKVINSSSDPIARNRNINAAYANLYLSDNRLRWPGAAAFASKQVGCGMVSAKAMGPLGQPVYNALVSGNKEVFKDIYPVHRFYQKNGIEGLRKCADQRNPPVDPKVMKGFEAIDKGDYDKGANSILLHEQQDILQSKHIFNDWKVKNIMGINQSAVKHGIGWRFEPHKGWPFEPTTTAFTAACKGEPTVTFEGENPANFEERWPFAQKVVGKFTDTLAHGTPDQLKNLTDQLKIIAKGQSGG